MWPSYRGESIWEEEHWGLLSNGNILFLNLVLSTRMFVLFLKTVFKLHGLYIIGKYFLATPGMPGFELTVLVRMSPHFSSLSSLKVLGVLSWEATQGNQENTSSECHSFIQLTLSTIFDGVYSEFSVPGCPDWISWPQFYKTQPSLVLDDSVSLWDAQKDQLRVLFHLSVLKSSKTCGRM